MIFLKIKRLLLQVCFFLCEENKSYTYDAGSTYDAGQPYKDEIRQLLIKIVQKMSLRTPSKKRLWVLGIRTLFKNEFAIGEVIKHC
jgi:hypothetical protein